MIFIKNTYKIVDDYVIIYLNDRKENSYETLIDLEDFDKVNAYNGTWFAYYSNKTKSYYVRNSIFVPKELHNGIKHRYDCQLLHDLVMDANTKKGEMVDHIHHDTLDNRKKNLRITHMIDNGKNRKTKNSNNTSGYRNVTYDKRLHRWLVQLQIDGKNTCVGKFPYDQLDEAGKFAEKKRKEIYGEFAGNN